MRALRLVVGVLLALVLGRALARYLFALPYDAAWFTGAVATTLRAVGRRDLVNPDDIQTVATAVLLILCVAVAGLFVWVLGRLLFAQRPR